MINFNSRLKDIFKGYRSIIHPNWQYLLKLDNGQTCFTNDQANERRDKFENPAEAILCKKSARRLEVSKFNFKKIYAHC